MINKKKEFALKAIRRYVLNPEECAITDTGSCMYKMPDGRMCVLGQFLIDPLKFNGVGTAWAVFYKKKQSKVLIPEAVDVLATDEWEKLQSIHDTLATYGSKEDIKYYVDLLGLFTYEEMMAP